MRQLHSKEPDRLHPQFPRRLDAVTPQITSLRVARFISGNGTADRVFAFGQCHKDLSQSDCDLCFAVCKNEILRCTPFQRMVTEGRLFLGGCYLRYDDYNFFGEIASPMDRLVCNRSVSVGGNSTGFVHEAKGMLRNLPNLAVGNNRFWRGNVGNGDSTVFAIGQCWDTMNASACGTCLNNAAVKVQSCLPAGEGRFMGSGCYLRYTNYKFYNDSIAAPPSQSNAGSRKFATIFAVCSSVLVVVMVVTGFIYFTMRKIERKRREKRQLGNLAATVKKSALNFKYEVLERATNYFDQANKLGQGGSGSVYKGTLADGKEIAIKRLFFNTRQWVDEFFNEVNLISGIEHKNLVKLLGCSITGPESLLVYEYVPNKSVDRVLFDAENTQRLTWEMRLNIVMGTAEGLAYLHEGCQLRIIHRDIKLSNVLLDEEFNAKIADFGLVRCFPLDKTHISTGIAGTLGYMAPEYLVRGKLTEKADIYSFGILLIEIITGRRIIAHYKNMNSSLHLVWNLYVSNRLVEAMDPKIEGNFSKEDVEHVLKVGLLCTQASADLRPPMSRVLRMLSDVDYVLPSPTQPPFINSSASDQEFPYPGSSQSQHDSGTHSSTNTTLITILEPR